MTDTEDLDPPDLPEIFTPNQSGLGYLPTWRNGGGSEGKYEDEVYL